MMLNKFIVFLGFLFVFPFFLAAKEKIDKESCSFNGIPLYGKVKVVEHFADFKVKVVSYSFDLKVQVVSAFANRCGKWQIVEHFPDFKVQIVEHFEDFKIHYVEHFPGVR